MATIAIALVAAVVLTVVLTRPDGGSGNAGSEVFLQAAGKSGPDPYTPSTARGETPSETPAEPSESDTGTNVTRTVRGSAPGLYGGTRKVASCDVEQQVTYLTENPDKNDAFASVQDVEPGSVPDYLRSLTPVRLRMDTRVTNHGYKDGTSTPYQAVLQSGTAVMVDDRGVPRVRCACGNPLLDPVPQKGTPKTTGDSWPGYRQSDVVVVTPAPEVVKVFVVFDEENESWFARPKGDTGGTDKKTKPPKKPSPSVSTPSTSPSGSSTAPSPPTPSSEPPSPGTPTPEPPSPESSPPQPPPPPPPPPDSGGSDSFGTPAPPSGELPPS